jgi:hypothetical protein
LLWLCLRPESAWLEIRVRSDDEHFQDKSAELQIPPLRFALSKNILPAVNFGWLTQGIWLCIRARL